MYINDFDEYQQAMRKINLNESSLPTFKGRLIESVDVYNKCRQILECPEMYKAHRFCYNIDWDNVDECVEEKINKLYECGKNRGFIHDETCDNEECADESCCDESTKDVDLGALEGVTEASEDDETKEETVEDPKADVKKPEEPVGKPKDKTPAEEPEATGSEEASDANAGDDAEEPKAEDGSEDDSGESVEDKQKADEEDAEKSEEESDKDDDLEKKEKDDGKDDNGLSAEEKQNLKDEYGRLFKSIMINNKFETSFCDLTIQDRAKVYGELAEKWTKAKPQDFMTKAEEKKLEGEEFKV